MCNLVDDIDTAREVFDECSIDIDTFLLLVNLEEEVAVVEVDYPMFSD
jgi:hypothetical protein